MPSFQNVLFQLSSCTPQIPCNMQCLNDNVYNWCLHLVGIHHVLKYGTKCRNGMFLPCFVTSISTCTALVFIWKHFLHLTYFVDVTSKPITPDTCMTELTKVSSTPWVNSVCTQVQFTQCFDVMQCLCQVRCSLNINITTPQSQFSEDSVPP